jgi:microsomal dipeptidase-like Zn-dependent dipeptidase
MHRRPRISYVIVAGAVLMVMIAMSPGGATARTEWTGAAQDLLDEPRAQTPEDRYAMAGGCYTVRSAGGGYVIREGERFAATGTGLEGAEPFHFQATDLGRYLLFDTSENFVAASEGLAGQAVYGVTRSTPGATAGGLVLEQTDRAADEVARSPVNEATGRGSSVVAAEAPSDLADWEIDDAGDGGFSIVLPETNQALATDDEDNLVLVAAEAASPFAFELTDGCASFPETEINVEGPVLGGENSFQEVRGFLDAHMHMMAFEFIGGRVRCGRPWHRFGVTHALVDCPDHEPGGHGAALEAVLSGGDPVTGHNTDGWPTFEGWPRPGSLTHEQVYYKWLERAWRGGLRMFTNLLVDNGQLCRAYPFKRNSCNEMDAVRLQAQRLRELERYIDAQSGGPGEGWFRIVTDPFEARRVINEGKLAVVLGIEVSVPLDCGLTLDMPKCDLDDIDERLQEVYDLGARQMELVNKFDNAFSGVTGDSGLTGPVVNTGNFGETGRFWRFETCGEHEGHAHDKQQLNFHDDSPAPGELSDRDSIFGAILALSGKSGAAPVYPEGPHCNVLGLSPLGEHMIREMVERGMIFDPDHMSARARTQAMDLIESLGYSGVVSSHGWADDTIYPRVYEQGGVVTPHAGDSAGFVEKWEKHKAWADPRFYFGFGFGSDVNGFSAQGNPRGADADNPVTYPFTGFGGVTIDQQHSGTRTYDINTDGVAHYGLYPDWIEDLRRQAGDEIIEDMVRGPEAFLQMWERAIGIAPDACRTDVDDFTDEHLSALQTGMSPEQVLSALGQPSSRMGASFSYCLTGERTATLTFTPEGSLTTWSISHP